jgi:hypothetical protein
MLSPAAIVAITLASQGGAIQQFPDVPRGHWAYSDVLNLRREGILHGYPDGTFLGKQPETADSKPKAR